MKLWIENQRPDTALLLHCFLDILFAILQICLKPVFDQSAVMRTVVGFHNAL